MKDILVIGDACRDIFVYCDSNRLCPDIPVPVLNVLDSTENPGMAKNVQRNIISLGYTCDAIVNKNWYNVTKTRYVHKKSNHTFFRVDSVEGKESINIKELSYSYKIIVISDYDKGFISEYDIETICANHDTVFLDTKKKLGSWANNAKYIKINDTEFRNSYDAITPTMKNKIIHTLGNNGCEYRDKHYPVNKVDVQDVSGAGDTFLAGLVVEYFKTSDIVSSIEFANKCASNVVKYRGVSVPQL